MHICCITCFWNGIDLNGSSSANQLLCIFSSIHPFISVSGLGAVRVPFYGIGSTRLCRTLALHASLSCGSISARPKLLASVCTHSDHVFFCFPCFLLPRIRKFLIVLIHDVSRCTWPYHLSRWLWQIDRISSMPSFCSSKAEGVLSLISGDTDPADHGMVIAAEPLQFMVIWSPCLLLWSIDEQTQASNVLPCILG